MIHTLVCCTRTLLRLQLHFTIWFKAERVQYSITLHRTLFVQGWCDVLEQDRTVESSTPYGIGMLSLRNGLLRPNRCIELGKRYIKALASARVKQLSPGSHTRTKITPKLPPPPESLPYVMPCDKTCPS